MTKIYSILTARYPILCTCRLLPPRDDCVVRVQCFSSVHTVATFGVFDGEDKRMSQNRPSKNIMLLMSHD